MPLLILLDSEGREQKRWRLRPGRLTLGRAESCDLIVPAAGVSRAHATLEVAADGQTAWFDPGSANGTFVNGLPARFLILRDGDRLRFGEASALYLEQEEDEALEPAQTPAAPGFPASRRSGRNRFPRKRKFLPSANRAKPGRPRGNSPPNCAASPICSAGPRMNHANRRGC